MPRADKTLRWRNVRGGIVPDCVACRKLMESPKWTEAVNSVALETNQNPDTLGRRAITTNHEKGHPAQ